jgi:hypothetical protein
MKVGTRKESRSWHFSVAQASFHSAEGPAACGSFYGSCSTVPLSPQTRKPTAGDLGTECAALPEHQTLLRKTARLDRNQHSGTAISSTCRRTPGYLQGGGKKRLQKATADGNAGILPSAAQLNKRKVNGSVTIWPSVHGPKRFPVWDEGAGPSRALLPWCRDPGSCCSQKRTTACTAHSRPCRLLSRKSIENQRIAVSSATNSHVGDPCGQTGADRCQSRRSGQETETLLIRASATTHSPASQQVLQPTAEPQSTLIWSVIPKDTRSKQPPSPSPSR